jgi:sn-glycerol 3-phosphate transport system ATP-binding protein
LARTIVAEQPVCLMDEPLSNLDAKLRAEMRDEIRALQQRLGMTMVYVTHDQIEAMTMADEVVLLNAGRIEQDGPPHDLYRMPATTFAARFIGSPPMNLLDLTNGSDGAMLQTEDGPVRIDGVTAGWKVGIRPEKVEIGESGLPARIVATDYLGGETVLRLRMGGQELFARSNGWSRREPGSGVRVSWPEDAVHLFDEHGFRRNGHDAGPPASAPPHGAERMSRAGPA